MCENYRLTSPFGGSTFKRASQSDVEIHYTTIPKNSTGMVKKKFNGPVYLEDDLGFKHERWMPDQAAACAGADLEEIYHALFRDSFGQGARWCPRSRVATNEVLIMIAQLVLDYEIRPPFAHSNFGRCEILHVGSGHTDDSTIGIHSTKCRESRATEQRTD
jgi:hypothetical protein